MLARPAVLNAFRHHGEDHPNRPCRTKQRKRQVLNAFRHHGEDHTLLLRRTGRNNGAVLNAFRHHGEDHGPDRRYRLRPV